jgi:hypothetical protein
MRKLARLVLFAVALSAGWAAVGAAVSTAYAHPPNPCFEDGD